MDQTFSITLAHCANFYIALATGGATFSGLLFVALSLHVDLIAREEKHLLRTAARLTFNLFLTVFFAALLLLLPNLTPDVATLIIAGLGAAGLVAPLFAVVQQSRNPGWLTRLGPLRLPLAVPVLLDLLLIRQGFAVGAGDDAALALLPVLLAGMLAVAAFFSWSLLIELARYKVRATTQDAEATRDRGLERQLRSVARELRAQQRAMREALPPEVRERAGRR